MTMRLLLALTILVTLTGCASRLNPLNWFGRAERVAPAETLTPIEAQAARQDRRPLIDQITRLTIERTAGGAIVRAAGLPPRQGYYDGALVSLSDGEPVEGVLSFRFVASPPLAPTRVSTPPSREVIVSTFVSDQTLARTREIRVTAARNAQAARR